MTHILTNVVIKDEELINSTFFEITKWLQKIMT